MERNEADVAFVLRNKDGSMNTPTTRQLDEKLAAVLRTAGTSLFNRMRIREIARRVEGSSEGRRAYLYDDLEEIEAGR